MITRLSITNMGGIAALDTALPAVCLLQGRNGSGKSTLLAALKYLTDRGHDPDIIHGNAEFGEIIVTLSDGNQLRARASRTTGETTRGWKPIDGKRWIPGREMIDKLTRAIGYDPVRFLEKTPREQAEELLKLAPIEVSAEEIREAVGDAEPEAAGAALVPGMSGLDVLNAIHAAVYRARRDIGRDADVQVKHAAALEQALPAAAPGGKDWSAEVARLRKGKSIAEGDERAGIEVVRQTFEGAKAAAEKACREEHARIDVDIEARIAALREEQATRKQAAMTTEASDIETARNAANVSAAKIRADVKPVVEKLQAALGAAEQSARIEEQAIGTRRGIETARATAAGLSARVVACTAALERLQALKGKLAGRLPIPGVRVEDGRIVREEGGGLVPLAKWNTADQHVLGVADWDADRGWRVCH